MDGLTVGTDSLTGVPGAYAEALDCDLKFITSGDENWYIASGADDEYYYDADAMKSYDTLTSGKECCLQTIVDIDSAETVKFYWKVSCQEDYDYLEFYIDGTLQDQITGNVDWQQKSYSVDSGIHILKWRYISGGGDEGSNCGWVDFVQWTGPTPNQNPQQWGEITYKHDVTGRRVEKKVDGYSTRYVYDGDHVIAEYDGNNNLLRKYIYGPGVDKPVCMIEVADDNATYYYHYDALGSVIALSDSDGDTVQTYEYSIYGEVAVEDANHTNPYMSAGRRYDIEIGLYYNRARYYNPYTGRFLQTDPIGYGDGMNLYRYCRNNPLKNYDPSGLTMIDSVTHPLSLPEYIAWYGMKDAIATFGHNAVINYVIQTAGTSIAVSGQMVLLLPKLIEPNDTNTDPNSGLKKSQSFEMIMGDKETFEEWAEREGHPKSRRYNEYEVLRIIENYIINFGGKVPTIHDDGGGYDDENLWGPHMHKPNMPWVHIPITKEALDLLKEMGYEIIYH